MQLIQQLEQEIIQSVQQIFGIEISSENVSITDTRPEFEGNLTLVIFALLKKVKGNPVQIGEQIGAYLKEHSSLVSDYNVVKGFLNLSISDSYWINFINDFSEDFWSLPKKEKNIVLEYCGPNTNKPLHLGHVRNMLIGWSTAEILDTAGYDVHKVNIYNDRGIAISKSMVAWEEYGNGETPESAEIKGDHLVGKYYVKYASVEKEQAKPFLDQGLEPREAAKQTEIFKKAKNYLQLWEQGDEHVLELWKKMNSWVYDGFQKTFNKIGVDFEKEYYESNTYILGKEFVLKGLEDGLFYQKEDSSIWVDLEEQGLDQKLLLRADGTSVYITQDLGTVDLRFSDFKMDEAIYVVGNEQEYHFQVLKAILEKMDKPYASGVQHLSYGMVELPSGKMKSREGTVVDADDLIAEMIATAKAKTEELGKIDGLSLQEQEELFETLGLGALKFFMLRVDPKKGMLFNPKESIEFQGFTGPFVQYTHARINSLLQKADVINHSIAKQATELTEEEVELIKQISSYQQVVEAAANNRDTSSIAKYAYDLAKIFNRFYANVEVNKEEDEAKRQFRLQLAKITQQAIHQSLHLLGIKAPNKM